MLRRAHIRLGEQQQLVHIPCGGPPHHRVQQRPADPPAPCRGGHRQRPHLTLAGNAQHLTAVWPGHQHHRAENLPVVHGGEDLAGTVHAQHAQRVRIAGRRGEEPVGLVGGHPQFADLAELLGVCVTYVHGRLQRPRRPRHSGLGRSRGQAT